MIRAQIQFSVNICREFEDFLLAESKNIYLAKISCKDDVMQKILQPGSH